VSTNDQHRNKKSVFSIGEVGQHENVQTEDDAEGEISKYF